MDNGDSVTLLRIIGIVLQGRKRITGAQHKKVDWQHKHVIHLTLKITVKSKSVLKYLYDCDINVLFQKTA
jgi:hypothetical protein